MCMVNARHIAFPAETSALWVVHADPRSFLPVVGDKRTLRCDGPRVCRTSLVVIYSSPMDLVENWVTGRIHVISLGERVHTNTSRLPGSVYHLFDLLFPDASVGSRPSRCGADYLQHFIASPDTRTRTFVQALGGPNTKQLHIRTALVQGVTHASHRFHRLAHISRWYHLLRQPVTNGTQGVVRETVNNRMYGGQYVWCRLLGFCPPRLIAPFDTEQVCSACSHRDRKRAFCPCSVILFRRDATMLWTWVRAAKVPDFCWWRRHKPYGS
ncbi:unnamed protein product [Rhizoctonia solani]|uniref:Uncharacterized protein n=1 Tax=Rhizoctonia solani TaxID=456999 RepID=A0A8H3BS10_9AGAM|nr:unnamed protein product [Rhizoctonia solani]